MSRISNQTTKKLKHNDMRNMSFAAGCNLNGTLVVVANIFNHIFLDRRFGLAVVTTISDDPWNVLMRRVQGVSPVANLVQKLVSFRAVGAGIDIIPVQTQLRSTLCATKYLVNVT
jgi:hypothetical protein